MLKNANIRFDDVDIGDDRVQVAIPDIPNRTWITSLTTAIGPVAREEIDRELGPIAAVIAKTSSHLFEAFGRLFKIDKVVFPSHRLLTTSLYREGEVDKLLAASDLFAARYPTRAIAIRSLNAREHQRHLRASLWPFRLVWIVEDLDLTWASRRDTRRDLDVLNRLPLSTHRYRSDMPSEKLHACLKLYQDLYLDTYSRFNPDYGLDYIFELLRSGGLDILTLEDETHGIEAFCALHTCEHTLSIPMLGYNRTRAQSDGLYRAIMAAAMLSAKDEGLRVNLSAGAARFKRNRGARPIVEYLLIIDKHLPWTRRFGYFVIGSILRRLAPLLERSAQ